MSETPGVLANNLVRQVHTPDGIDYGHIRYETVDVMDVAAGTTGTKIVTWPYPVGISSAALYRVVNTSDWSEAQDYGDTLCAYVDLVSGYNQLTSTAEVDDTSLFLPPSVIARAENGGIGLSVGDFLGTGDNIDSDPQYHVTGVNRETGEVSIAGAVTAQLTAGTVLHMHRFFVGRPDSPYRVIPGAVRRWGEDTFDSALVPTGVPLKVVYHNASGVERSALGEISILYGDA